MTHHRYDRRLPKRTEGFAWGRSIDKVLGGHVLTYRLFRRAQDLLNERDPSPYAIRRPTVPQQLEMFR